MSIIRSAGGIRRRFIKKGVSSAANRVSVTAECTVVIAGTIVGGTTHTGVVNTTVDTTTSIAGQLILPGNVIATVDTTTTLVGERIVAGVVNATVDTIATVWGRVNEGLTHLGIVSATVDTSASPTGQTTLAASIAATTESTTTIDGTVLALHKGIVTTTVDTAVSVTGSFLRQAAISLSTEATTLIAGTLVPAIQGQVSVSSDTTTVVTGQITFAGQVAAAVTTTTTIVGRLAQHGAVSAIAEATVSASAFTPQYITCHDYAFQPASFPESQDFVPSQGNTPSIPMGQLFAIRWSISEDDATTETDLFRFELYARLNSGTWANAGTGDVPVITAAHLPYSIATSERMTTGQNFVTGLLIKNDYTNVQINNPLSAAYTELGFCLGFPTMMYDVSDVIELKLRYRPSDTGIWQDVDAGTAKATVSITLAASNRNLEQVSFRGREDDGSETGATWIAAKDTDFSQAADTPFRLRFQVDQKSIAPVPNFDPSGLTLQYRHQTNTKWDVGVDLAWPGDVNFYGPFSADKWPYSSFGSHVVVSGDGEVIVIAGDHYPYTSTSYTNMYIYRWNSGTSVYDWDKTLALGDYSGAVASKRHGWNVELNYAGDMLYVNSSTMKTELPSAGTIYVFSYSGGTWSAHSNIARGASNSQYTFGYRIFANVAGTTVLASSSTTTSPSRYIWNGSTWDTVTLISLGVASGDCHYNFSASPNLETIIFNNGSVYKWVSGTSTYDIETDDVAALVATNGETMRLNNGLTKLFTYKDIGYQDTSGFPTTQYVINEHELNTDYTSKEVNDSIHNTFNESRNSYDVYGSFVQRYDVSDDHTVLAVAQPFMRYINKGHSVRVYRKKTNSWHSINPQHGAPVVYSSKEITTTGSKYVYNETPTTQQISTGGTFEPAPWSDDAYSLVYWPKSGTALTEVEFCLQINSEFVATSDDIDFRVVAYNGEQDNEQELETYTSIPTVTVTGVKAPSIDVGFRGRDDDGNETAATWLAAADTQFKAPIDTTFRLRSLVKEEGLSAAQTYHLQYNYNNEEKLAGKFVRSPKKSNSTSESFSARNVIAVSDDGNITVEGNRYMTNTNYRAGGIICNKWNASTFEWARPSVWNHISTSANVDWGAHIEITSDGTKGLVSYPRYSTVYEGGIRPITIAANGAITAGTGFTVGIGGPRNLSIKDDLARFVYSDEDGNIITRDEAHNILSTLITEADTSVLSLSGDGKVLAVVRIVATGWNVEIYDWEKVSESWVYRELVLGSLLTHEINGWDDMAINTDGTELFFLTGAYESYHTSTGRLTYEYERNKVSVVTYNGTSWAYQGVVAYVEDTKLHLSKNCQYLLAGVDGVGALMERTWVWNNVENSGHGTAKVMYDNSTFLTDKQATTQQLGSGTFVAGDVAESQWPATTFTATVDEESEHEHVLQMPLSRIGLTEPIRYRIVPSEGTAIEYNVYPYLFPLIIFPDLTQRDFRGRNDDGWEDTATWKALLNTDWSDAPAVSGRIRFVLENTASVNIDADRSYNLQYNKNHDGTFYIYDTPIITSGFGVTMQVAISGDGLVLAIGDYVDNEVTTYNKQSDGSWLSFKVFGDPAVGNIDEWGRGLALNTDGTILYVGDPKWDDGTVSQQGRVWRYTWNGGTTTWDIDSTVIVADWLHLGAGPQVNEYFGMDIAISGADDVLAIGAPGFDYGAYTDSGCVYLYKKTTGTWGTEGFYAFYEDYWQNGFSVALSEDGSRLAMGAPQYDTYSGAVWFANYEGGSWVLRNYGVGGASAGVNFGESVTMDKDGRVVLIGAPLLDLGTTYIDAGALYIYDYDGGNTAGSLVLRHTLQGNADYYRMGRGVALAADAFSGVMCRDRIQHNIGNILNWTNIGSRTDITHPVRFVNTSWLTDKEATTQQISSDTNYDAGEVATLDYASVTYTDTGVTELEYAIEFYEPEIINTDVFKFRVKVTDDAFEDELVYDEIPVIPVYSSGLHEGQVSAVVTCTATPGFTYTGVVNAVVTCTATPEVQLTGKTTAVVDTTATVTPTAIFAGKVTALTKFYAIPTGRLADRGIITAYFGTRVNARGRMILNAVTSATADSNIIAHAINSVNGIVAAVSDASTNIQGYQEVTGIVDAITEATVVVSGSIYNEAKVHARTDILSSVTGDLTLGAKCGIIIGSSVNISSVNEVKGILSVNVTTSVTSLSSHITRNASTSVSSNSSSSIVAHRIRSAINSVSANTSVSITGTVLESCDSPSTVVKTRVNTTTVRERPNITIRYCP